MGNELETLNRRLAQNEALRGEAYRGLIVLDEDDLRVLSEIQKKTIEEL